MSDDNRPACVLLEGDNIFSILGIAAKALKSAGQGSQVSVMNKDVEDNAQNYEEAVKIVRKYVRDQ